MIAHPMISVLMPAYEHEAYIGAAIDSVLNQTWRDFELIVIDDASRDRTWDVVSRYVDSRIRSQRHAVNQGAHATLNEALSIARGDYVAILNSDDIYHPARLQYLLDMAKRSNRSDFLAFSDISFIDQKGLFVPEDARACGYRKLSRKCSNQSPQYWFYTGNLAWSTSNFFFSRGILEKTGPFTSLRYTHDWDWALRASSDLIPTWIRKPLLCYRVHPLNTLAEGDVWRHVHENSYIQASTLHRLLMRAASNREGDIEARELGIALLKNESLHPLSLLCFLLPYLVGKADSVVIDWARGNAGEWVLPELAREAGRSTELFMSLPYLAEKDRVIDAQASLIEERWRAMEHMSREISDRDKWIAEQQIRLTDRDKWITDQQANLAELESARHEELVALQAEISEGHAALADCRTSIDKAHAMLSERENELAALHADRYISRILSIRGKWAGLLRWLSR
jgi:glycosyltransferase involved in cell wall biosynthesis